MIAGLEDREYHARWRAANRDKMRAASKKSYMKHREKNIARSKVYNAAHPEKQKSGWSKVTPEQQAAATARWRARNPERYKASCLKRATAWNAANRDRRRANLAAWYAANPDYKKAWLASNPGKNMMYQRHWRARKLGTAVGPVSVSEWLALCAQYGHRCAYCLRSGKLEQDHIDPLSRGGAHAIDNIAPACRSCNARKNAQPLLISLLTGALNGHH